MGAHGRPENQPETESRLTELASKSGRATGDLVEVALCGYLREVAEVREMLDGRYDDIKSGRVEPIAMLVNASSGRTDGRLRFEWQDNDSYSRSSRHNICTAAAGPYSRPQRKAPDT